MVSFIFPRTKLQQNSGKLVGSYFFPRKRQKLLNVARLRDGTMTCVETLLDVRNPIQFWGKTSQSLPSWASMVDCRWKCMHDPREVRRGWRPSDLCSFGELHGSWSWAALEWGARVAEWVCGIQMLSLLSETLDSVENMSVGNVSQPLVRGDKGWRWGASLDSGKYTSISWNEMVKKGSVDSLESRRRAGEGDGYNGPDLRWWESKGCRVGRRERGALSCHVAGTFIYCYSVASRSKETGAEAWRLEEEASLWSWQCRPLQRALHVGAVTLHGQSGNCALDFKLFTKAAWNVVFHRLCGFSWRACILFFIAGFAF